jgi:NADH dehydrogenase FAD-containing subunit
MLVDAIDERASTCRIVVIGGGLASQLFLEDVQKEKFFADLNAVFVVIKGNYYLEMTWGTPHMLVEERAQSSDMFDKDVRKGEIRAENVSYVYGTVTKVVGENASRHLEMKLEDGSTATEAFDYLVVATGFSVPALLAEPGISADARASEITELRTAIQAAKHVLVAGGSALGCEMAGLVAESTAARVSLVCSSDEIVPNGQMSKRSRTKITQVLEKKGVNMMYNERVQGAVTIIEKGASYMLSNSKKTVEADVYLPCYSTGPRTGFLRDGPYANSLSASWHIEMTENLNSAKHPELFAIGRCR